MGLLFGKLGPVIVVVILITMLAQPAVKARAVSGETVGQFAQRVPINFYARAVTRGVVNPAYQQRNENFCILYASAFAVRADPIVVRAALELARPGATQSLMGDVVGVMGAFGWNLQSENYLLNDAKTEWNTEQPYSAWLQKTRQWVSTHLPAMVYPRVPDVMGAPYHAIVVLRWSGGTVRFFDPYSGELLDVPEQDAARAIIGDNIGTGGWVSHYVWAGAKK